MQTKQTCSADKPEFHFTFHRISMTDQPFATIATKIAMIQQINVFYTF